MDIYEALYTTRAMRRCRPDKIPMDVQQRILDAAVRAPTGGNRKLRSIGSDGLEQAVRIVASGAADLEVDDAAVGHDVDHGPAGDLADMDGRVGHLESGIHGVALRDRRLSRAEAGDEVRGEVDGVEAGGSERRMRGATAAGRTERELALVARGDAHRRRLADDGEVGPDAVLAKPLEHRPHADTAGLLVMREGEAERRHQPSLRGDIGRP